jgi:hypothetical protein
MIDGKGRAQKNGNYDDQGYPKHEQSVIGRTLGFLQERLAPRGGNEWGSFGKKQRQTKANVKDRQQYKEDTDSIHRSASNAPSDRVVALGLRFIGIGRKKCPKLEIVQ